MRREPDFKEKFCINDMVEYSQKEYDDAKSGSRQKLLADLMSKNKQIDIIHKNYLKENEEDLYKKIVIENRIKE